MGGDIPGELRLTPIERTTMPQASTPPALWAAFRVEPALMAWKNLVGMCGSGRGLSGGLIGTSRILAIPIKLRMDAKICRHQKMDCACCGAARAGAVLRACAAPPAT